MDIQTLLYNLDLDNSISSAPHVIVINYLMLCCMLCFLIGYLYSLL